MKTPNRKTTLDEVKKENPQAIGDAERAIALAKAYPVKGEGILSTKKGGWYEGLKNNPVEAAEPFVAK